MLITPTSWSEICTLNGSIVGQLTPRHAFDPTLTTVVAVMAAVGTVILSVIGRRFVTRRQLLVGGGATYATVMLSLWAGVRLIFWRFAFDPVGDALIVAPVLVGFALVIAGQFVLPVYLLVTHETWTPLVWLFGVTWAFGEFILLVGGESGGLFTLLVWVVGLLPLCFGVLVVTTGGELFFRRVNLSDIRGS
ncbi:hypothetical protein [Haloarcula montana]|uniref:hypothetical protein n=1 Tax=Haloarcula montana TaxID=3111776 RepID=UPI002D77EDD2|nr:hypothetical protein [Haloarcula sp. GH36]